MYTQKKSSCAAARVRPVVAPPPSESWGGRVVVVVSKWARGGVAHVQSMFTGGASKTRCDSETNKQTRHQVLKRLKGEPSFRYVGVWRPGLANHTAP